MEVRKRPKSTSFFFRWHVRHVAAGMPNTRGLNLTIARDGIHSADLMRAIIVDGKNVPDVDDVTVNMLFSRAYSSTRSIQTPRISEHSGHLLFAQRTRT